MRSLEIPAAVLSHAERVAVEFRDRTGVTVDAGQIITGRAALLGLAPNGRISAGGAQIQHLLSAADVVIESSRPAALTRRGLGPHDVTLRDGRVWLRITGHGAEGEYADWVAFGDDAAVSGGLLGTADDGPVFCGDAIADPLTGLHAALTVADSLARGGGELIEMSMAAVAATYAKLSIEPAESLCPAEPPLPKAPASKLGEDNAEVDRLVSERRLAAC